MNDEESEQVDDGSYEEGMVPNPLYQRRSQSPEQQNAWDKIEEKKREEIRTRFTRLIEMLKESRDSILDIVRDAPVEFAGRDNRKNLTEEQLNRIFFDINNLNYCLGQARPMLDAYIRFQHSTPDFGPVNNLLYALNQFLVDTQKRQFYILWSQPGVDFKGKPHEPKHYFRAVPLRNVVNKLSFLIERILGALETGGNYIVDIPKRQTQSRYDGVQSRFGSYGGSSYGGGGGYDNINGGYDNRFGNKFWDRRNPNFEDMQRSKSVKKQSPQRDFGDNYEDQEMV